MQDAIQKRLILNVLLIVAVSIGILSHADGNPCSTYYAGFEYPVEFVGPTADWRPQDFNDSQGITEVCYDVNQD